MRRVIRWVCDVCQREHPNVALAAYCEEQDLKIAKARETAIAEEKHWQSQGHAVWHERGGMCHAPEVDDKLFSTHDYGVGDGTSDCAYKCGCWMGPCASGGPVDPFGPCPKNPVKERQL